MSDSAQTSPLPERIGPYKVLDVLGEGGMGVVYEAEETGPVRRRVAVKVVRAGLATRETVARFDAERQAMALMDHAGIAKVFAAGETETGAPFVVMELVRGQPLTTYCDSHHLTVDQRVELFIQVCHAVQHAHQKGVIHRDLKPTNVLVIEEDGRPRAKVIDFGIAKAVGRPLTESTLVTHAGIALGTAAYMSPEQAETGGLDVDTRADIYSLGVMLYELLVGRLPVEPEVMGYHAFMARLSARETLPPAPSTRLQTLGVDRALIATRRQTNPEALRRSLRGDLDWIVLKALEPERSRRYATANGLALDLQRARDEQPVSARPPSTRYRLRKFIRRHRVGVASTTLAILALLTSSVAATAGLLRAQRAEARAEAEAAAAREVTNFVVGLFGVFDPDAMRTAVPAGDISARELLDRGAERARLGLDGQPAQLGRILHTIGSAYMSLGLYDVAREQLAVALDARERALPSDDAALAETYLALGQAARNGRDFIAAETYLNRALAIRERDFGASSSEVAQVVASLALVRWRQGRLAEAETLYLRAVRIDDAVLEPDHPRLARDLMGLGVVYWAQGRYADAEPMMRRSLEVEERISGPNDGDVASALNNLGAVCFGLERYREAQGYYERTRAIYERTLDPTHPNMAAVLNNLGETHWKLGELDVAEPMLRRALAIKEGQSPQNNPSISTTLYALGGVLKDRGDWRAAEASWRRALDMRVQAYPAGHRLIVEAATSLVQLLQARGRSAEAAALETRYVAR